MIQIFLGVMVILIILMLFYLWKRFQKFNFIKKIAGEKKWLLRLLSAIPILIIIVFGYYNVINTVIVAIHLMIFWAIFDFVGFLVKKIAHKEAKIYWQGILTLIVTAIYLSIGWYSAHHVWETQYALETDKDLGMDSLRIVQISDSHVGATFHWQGFAKHMKTIQKTNPDIIVVTGDFVDDDTSKGDMIKCCESLGKMKTTYGIYMIYGNHDKGYFTYRNFTTKELEDELQKNNIILLQDEVTLIDDKFYLIGRQDRTESDRMSAEDLMKGLDTSKYMIMLDHQPNDYDNESATAADLVLSGHTHGGQLIPLGIIGLLSGANDREYGMETRNDTTFIVNSGISDWAIKFKTGTFSEYGMIDIKMKS